MFLKQERTTLFKGRSEEILGKYRMLIRKLKESRRKVVVVGLIPGYDGGSVTLRSISLDRFLGYLLQWQEPLW